MAEVEPVGFVLSDSGVVPNSWGEENQELAVQSHHESRKRRILTFEPESAEPSRRDSFVPASKQDLSTDWLEAALGPAFAGAPMRSLSRERIGEAFGFASEIYRCAWTTGGTRRSVVVKLWPTSSRAGVGEIRFYEAFADIGIRIPKMHHAAIDEATGRAVLILEDLSALAQGDCLAKLDLARAKGVAGVLGRMHGMWMGHHQLSELSWLPCVSSWDPPADWFRSRRSEFLERFADRFVGFPLELLNKIELAPEVANGRLARVPMTLLHDDFHLDNMLFERNSEPVLLDWSRPVQGPCVRNLADLLFYMSPLEHFDAVLQSYLEVFNEHSGTPLDTQSIQDQLGGSLLAVFSRGTCGTARWMPSSSREEELIDAGLASTIDAIEFWKTRDPELFQFARG